MTQQKDWEIEGLNIPNFNHPEIKENNDTIKTILRLPSLNKDIKE